MTVTTGAELQASLYY